MKRVNLKKLRKKEYDRQRYLTKIKPFRTPKQPKGYGRYRCPLCCKLSFLKNFEKCYKPFAYIFFMGGRGRIIVKEMPKNLEQYQHYISLLKRRIFELYYEWFVEFKQDGNYKELKSYLSRSSYFPSHRVSQSFKAPIKTSVGTTWRYK